MSAPFESYLPQINVSQLRATASDYPPEINRRYLRLPASTPERVLALAREITQVAPTPYDRVAAIETYLRTFPYTLEVRPPPSDRDLVDYFLFTAQQGYCDYYCRLHGCAGARCRASSASGDRLRQRRI